MKIDKVNILIGEDINPKLYVLKYTLEDCNNKIISSSYSVDIFKVIEFARKIHKDQKRKYTGDPYFSHLCEVVGLLSSVNNDNLSLAVAWLHDCMEDCGVSFEFLKEIISSKNIPILRTITFNVPHWILIKGYSENNFLVNDPWLGEIIYTEKELDNIWKLRNYQFYEIINDEYSDVRK